MARVLIIEDDPLISRMYQKVFQFEGFEVDMARDGQEGLDRLKANKPTIILLDIMMPIKTGVDVLIEIKADEEYKNIPVIMLTNLSGDEDVDKALSLGAVKYIVKSQNKPKQVVDQVVEILAATTREEIPNAALSRKLRKQEN